jgi:hypothetical protein
VAVASGLAHREADGSVVFNGPGDELVVQRQAEVPAAATETWTPAAPVVSRAVAPDAEDGESATWPGGPDWEELVHRLHEEVRWQLRAELRRDMGRFGFGSGIR